MNGTTLREVGTSARASGLVVVDGATSGIASSGNPNIAAKAVTNQWNDANGDRHWQPGEEGNELSRLLEGGVQLQDDIKQPFTHEASVWVERQLADTLGMRAGFVYKTEDDLIDTGYQPLRGLDAFTVPFTFVDLGVDGRRGTSDDANVTMLGLPWASPKKYCRDSLSPRLRGR